MAIIIIRERMIALLLLLFLHVITTTEAWISVAPMKTMKKTSTPIRYDDFRSIVVTKGRKAYYTTETSSRIFLSNTNNDKKKEDNDDNDDGGGLLGFIFNPYESKIPKELKDEIYQAEGNTQAAKERTTRIGLYALVAFVGILCAFFNGFLTEVRNDAGGGVEVLDEVGFGWANSNFLFSFIFLNKIGGLIALLGGAGAGLLAEAEFDTRRINAEKIYEELERRKASKQRKTERKKQKGGGTLPKKKKKRRSGKEKKRLEALGEVVLPDVKEEETKEEEVQAEPEQQQQESPSTTAEKKDDGGGILGSLKEFYDKADSMAETQARLLNKKLEDEGVLEKITDESGLKVIGKEEASKLQQQQQKQIADKEETKGAEP